MDADMILNSFLKYFWLICFVLGVAAYVNLRIKTKKIVRENNEIIEHKNGLKSFVNMYGICNSAPYLTLQIFLLAGNYRRQWGRSPLS